MSTPLRPPVSAGDNSAESKTKQQEVPGWQRELRLFLNRNVTVDFMLGDQRETVSGKLVAFDYHCFHCVVFTEAGESVIIRIPLRVSLKRVPQA